MDLKKDNFLLENSKIDEEKKIILMADLHLNLSMNKKILQLIQNFLNQNKNVDLITIPGDIMYAWQYSNPKYVKKLEYLLSAFREIAPVALSLGNHDLYKMNNEARRTFKDLSQIEDVYPLDNEQININGMTVTGFSPEHAAYSPSNHGEVANKMFVEDFQKSGLIFKEGDFNVLLNHAPHPIASEYAQSKLKELYNCVDLIVAGHLHNGYVPDQIEKIFKDKIRDYGIWEKISLWPPALFSKINLCRGAHDLGKSKLIITKGVRMYTGYVPASAPVSPHITEIDIKPKQR